MLPFSLRGYHLAVPLAVARDPAAVMHMEGGGGGLRVLLSVPSPAARALAGFLIGKLTP